MISKSKIMQELVRAAIEQEGQGFNRKTVLAQAEVKLMEDYPPEERRGITFNRSDVDRAVYALSKTQGQTKPNNRAKVIILAEIIEQQGNPAQFDHQKIISEANGLRPDMEFSKYNVRDAIERFRKQGTAMRGKNNKVIISENGLPLFQGKVNKARLLAIIIREEADAGRDYNDYKRMFLIARKRMEQYTPAQRKGITDFRSGDYQNALMYAGMKAKQGTLSAPSAAQKTVAPMEEYPVVMDELLAAKNLLSVCSNDTEKAQYLVTLVSKLQS